MEPEQTIPETQNPGENTNEFSDYTADYAESESFRDKLAGFFRNRRRLLIISAVLLLFIGGIAAVFAFRNNRGPASVGQAEVGKLPIAGEGSDISVDVAYPEDGTVVLSWTTGDKCDGRIYYGTTENYGYIADDQNTLTPALYSNNHKVVLRGLNAADIYHFRASSQCIDGSELVSSDFRLKPSGDLDAPSVTITDLTNGKVCAESTDNRAVVGMTLLIDGRPVQQTSESNFCFTYDRTQLKNGDHSITVVATDGTNNTSVNDKITITDGGSGDTFTDTLGCKIFDANLRATFTSLVGGAVLSGTPQIQISVQSGGRAVQKAVLLVDGLNASEDASSPYTPVLNTLAYSQGPHVLKPVAVAAGGVCSAYNAALGTNVIFDNSSANPQNSAPIISLVTVSTTLDSITVGWVSDKPTNSAVSYQTGTGPVATKQDANLTTTHSVNITGLTSNVLYRLTLKGTTAAGQSSEYNTTATTNGQSSPCFGSNCQSDNPNGHPLPTITLTATPPTINSGQNSTLNWSTQNASACAASGAWSGSKVLSGSMLVTPAATSTYWLTCTGPGGTANQNTVITVDTTPGTPLPSISLSATPSTITVGQSTTLNWSTQNATACTASNGWSGTKATSGSESMSPNVNTTYVLNCTGTGGPASQSIIVTVGTGDNPPCETPDCGAPVGPPPPVGCTSVDSTLLVTLSSPANNSTVSGNMTLTATANRPIASMAFLIGDQEIGSDPTSPYSMTVNSAAYPNGSYTIRAVGVASNGLCSSIEYTGPHTAQITINNVGVPCTGPNCPTTCTTVNTNIAVTLSSPASGSTVSGNMTAAASANTSITRMYFYLDSSEIGSDDSSPYSVTVNSSNYSNGNHRVKAVAVKPNGECSSTSDAGPHTANIIINNANSGDTQAPTAPTGLTLSSVGQTSAAISWTASTDNIGVTGYDVYRNDALVNSGTAVTFTDTGLQNGNVYYYYVKAKDAAGNISEPSYIVEAFTDTVFGITDYQTGADDILVNFQFTTNQAAASVISFGTSPTTLNRTVNVASGVSIWNDTAPKIVKGFWEKVSKKLAGLTPKARAFANVNLNAANYIIDRGQNTKLTWNSSSADNCRGSWVANNGSVALNGETTVSPVSTTRYTIVCASSKITNGNFTTNKDGWTDKSDSNLAINWRATHGGSLELTGGAAGYAAAEQQIAVKPGATYTARIRVHAAPNGPVRFYVGTNSNWSDLLEQSISTAGVHQYTFRPSTSTVYVSVRSGWQNAYVDDISVSGAEDADRSGVTIQVNHPYSVFATGLTANTTYYYKIVSTATKDSNLRSESPVLTFRTAAAPTVNNLTASISWTGASGGVGRVYYSRLPLTDPNANVLTVSAPSSGTGYTAVLVGLAAQKTYYYKYQTLTYCAAEGSICSFSGTKTVAYGANGQYVFTTATGSVNCNNDYNGGPSEFVDPAPGVVKACYVEAQTVTTDQSGQLLKFSTPVSN